MGDLVKLGDIVFLLMGLVFSAFGLKIFLNPKHESFRFGVVDFGEYHQYVGSVCLAFGIVVFIKGMKDILRSK